MRYYSICNVEFINGETNESLATFNKIIAIKLIREGDDLILEAKARFAKYMYRLIIKDIQETDIYVFSNYIKIKPHQ